LTWTVQAGDQTTYSYVVRDRRMRLSLCLQATSTGGAADVALRVAIPAGLTAGATVGTGCRVSDAGTPGAGLIRAASGNAYVEIFKADGTNWSNAAANNTEVYAQIEIPF